MKSLLLYTTATLLLSSAFLGVNATMTTTTTTSPSSPYPTLSNQFQTTGPITLGDVGVSNMKTAAQDGPAGQLLVSNYTGFDGSFFGQLLKDQHLFLTWTRNNTAYCLAAKYPAPPVFPAPNLDTLPYAGSMGGPCTDGKCHRFLETWGNQYYSTILVDSVTGAPVMKTNAEGSDAVWIQPQYVNGSVDTSLLQLLPSCKKAMDGPASLVPNPISTAAPPSFAAGKDGGGAPFLKEVEANREVLPALLLPPHSSFTETLTRIQEERYGSLDQVPHPLHDKNFKLHIRDALHQAEMKQMISSVLGVSSEELFAAVGEKDGSSKTTTHGDNELLHLFHQAHKRMMKKEGGFLLPEELPELSLSSIPKEVDNSKYATAIRQQGWCGACWTFGALAASEVIYRKARNITWTQHSPKNWFAVQEVLDCAPINIAYPIAPKGCQGGWPFAAGLYVVQHGIVLEIDYPYTAQTALTCGSTPASSQRYYPLSNAGLGYPKNTSFMMAAVAEYGAISAVINFYFGTDGPASYTGGVYDSPSCKPGLSHNIAIVGYGTDEESGKDYWLIKNSMGYGWGDGGYMKMVRGKNMCGIEDLPFLYIPKTPTESDPIF